MHVDPAPTSPRMHEARCMVFLHLSSVLLFLCPSPSWTLSASMTSLNPRCCSPKAPHTGISFSSLPEAEFDADDTQQEQLCVKVWEKLLQPVKYSEPCTQCNSVSLAFQTLTRTSCLEDDSICHVLSTAIIWQAFTACNLIHQRLPKLSVPEAILESRICSTNDGFQESIGFPRPRTSNMSWIVDQSEASFKALCQTLRQACHTSHNTTILKCKLC